ncbi:MAG: acetoin utilization protein AcuC [Promethearchaeota archaeon]
MIKNVGLIFSEDYFNYNFGVQHPLRPIRLKLTIKLMESYGLLKHPRLKMFNPKMASPEELYLIHDKAYVDIVKKYSNLPAEIFFKDNPKGTCGLGTMDDPIFPGMYESSALVAGAGIKGAEILMNDDEIDHVFNFGGGFHHASKKRAHGFCIFNDVAIAIQKLRMKSRNKKIMYLDIDAHHGDGVQQLFYKDADVLTLSIHQDGKTLFPGTGFLDEIGEGDGKYHSINMPLFPGTYDKMYIEMFESLVPQIMDAFSPDILVTQLGADTHFNDPLTRLGLTTTGHERLYKLIHKYAHEFCGGQWLAFGGGGYLMTVVPRSWTMVLETMLETNLPNKIPEEWVHLCNESITDEETPYELRDKNYRLEEQLLKNPIFSVRIEDRITEIEDFIENRIIPNLKSS